MRYCRRGRQRPAVPADHRNRHISWRPYLCRPANAPAPRETPSPVTAGAAPPKGYGRLTEFPQFSDLGRRRADGNSVTIPATRRGYPVLQETVGQVHWPLGEMVTPQLLPLPLGVAFSTYWLG